MKVLRSKRLLPLPLLLPLLLAAACSSAPTPELNVREHVDFPVPSAPVAERIPHTQSVNGIQWVDDYFWLRDRDNPEVIAYLETENIYTERMMAHTSELQDTLYEEMLGRIQETDLSVPYRRDNYYYYSRSEEGQAYTIFCRREEGEEGEEQILLDQNILAADVEYLDVGHMEVSPDHSILAYGVDTSGSEEYTVYFRDLATGEDAEATVEGVSYSMAWANDNRTIFYTLQDEQHRPYQLYRYELGGEPELVYEETDERFFLDVWATRSEGYLVMAMDSSITSERWVLGADDPRGEFELVRAREQGVEYSIEHHRERFFVWTNGTDAEEGAVNFRLMEASVDSPGVWTEVIPHRPEVQLVSVDAFADYLVIRERAGGSPQIRIWDLDTDEQHTIEFPEPVYSVYPEDNPEFESDTFRVSYTSLITPESIYDYHMDSRELELLKETPVLGDYDGDEYVSARLFATAEDGAEVPISVLYRADTALDGTAPMFLAGYGAYGYSYDPYFSSNRLSLLDRGFIYAVAHVRGGGEMGRPWYEDGKLFAKRNTFTDFIAVAEHLIAAGYTASDRLAIYGASAGGLLIGTVTNMRPDLFSVVVADVPFVDLINTMLDETIPLTVIEWEEWGNPNEPDYFEYMWSYSPYDNVEATEYPDMLVLAGLNDPRVQYWEPAKWTARLRATRTDDNWLLLKTNMDAGHFGSSGRYGRLHELAFIYAFILDRL
jgi:oligopeptidase B